jgi:glycosyltransferase involved in cell wall biosynthesis
MSRRKNLKRAVDVAASLRALDAGSHMLITGSVGGHDETAAAQSIELQAYIAERGLRDHVSVVSVRPGASGHVSRDDTTSLIALADVVLLTSDQEGFLLPVLEAALCGVPAIIPALPAVAWAESFARLFRPDADAETIARLILEAAAEGPSRARRLARSNYSWANILTSYFGPLLNGPR